jgi:hypothetical protein
MSFTSALNALRPTLPYYVALGNTPKAIVPRTTEAAARRANVLYTMPLPPLPERPKGRIA